MQRYSLFLTDCELRAVRSVAEISGLSASEAIRRMIDSCLRAEVIGDLFPWVSGSITLTKAG